MRCALIKTMVHWACSSASYYFVFAVGSGRLLLLASIFPGCAGRVLLVFIIFPGCVYPHNGRRMCAALCALILLCSEWLLGVRQAVHMPAKMNRVHGILLLPMCPSQAWLVDC